MLTARAISLEQANEYVTQFHRHHDAVYRDKFRIAAYCDGRMCGVVQVGRPVARLLDDGQTVEVTRLCTDGTKDACSFLYARAAQASKALGFTKIITYILDIESGTSLKASGWVKECDTKGHTWNHPSRPRATTAPTCDKQRWAKVLKGGDK